MSLKEKIEYNQNLLKSLKEKRDNLDFQIRNLENKILNQQEAEKREL